ncbi:MAG: hypothetical protein JST04_02610 [Bdellovibrionales bacterium]|nr:hypothetical protein [Bdellovibrionales bacterium]
MNKQIVSALAVLAFVPASLALACTEDGKHGIFPDNNLYIPDSSFGTYAVDEAQFNASIERAKKVYEPVFAAQGRKYNVIANWADGTVNAYADRSGSTSNVHMFGGLARHPKVTADGFELVICHETGHHLGGAPKNGGLFGMNKWASNEGQADYYATLKCAREMWKNDDNVGLVGKMSIPLVVTQQCQKSFDQANDIAICERGAMAGKALADTLADLSKLPVTDFETPDTSVVSKTFNEHPKAQCRLDTYFAGAVCGASKDAPLSDTDPTVGTCAQEKGAVLGIRPLCWYKPVDPNAPKGSVWPSSKIGQR